MAEDASTTETGTTPDEDPIPVDVVDRAETLTRRMRAAVDGNERAAYRREREDLLADYGYETRVREGERGETLVLYPTEWLEDGTIRTDRIEDTSRAVERSISGPGADADWDDVAAHNREIAERVRERYGEIHGETATAFATFMNNHYAKPLESATPTEREEFRTEYFPRNTWPTDDQRARLEESVQLALEVAEDA